MQNSISEVSKKIIEKISEKGTDHYANLPEYLKRFNYPVSLELSEWIGAKVYQKGFADPLEFLCLMANKFYTSIEHPTENVLQSFIIREGKSIESKSRALILAVKKWEVEAIQDSQLAKAITDFCRDTYGVRMPMASFFLRMLLPEKFGTLDVRCNNSLRSLGFNVKNLPPENTDKDTYLEKYSGFDYLEYNQLITEIGKHYSVPSKLGGHRHMIPSEVDMALYEFDKHGGSVTTPIFESMKALSKEEKVREIMRIVEEIVEGTRTGPPWVRKAGYSFLQNMRQHAANNDLNSMFNYYRRLAEGGKGKSIGNWLKMKNHRSVESEFERVKKIYFDSTSNEF